MKTLLSKQTKGGRFLLRRKLFWALVLAAAAMAIYFLEPLINQIFFPEEWSRYLEQYPDSD